MTPTDWLLSNDTGISSKLIWRVMMGSTAPLQWWENDVPHDPDDFGRCYRLLKQFPAWRARLNEVPAVYPAWGPMVAAWDELTDLYEKICEPDGRYTRASYEANKKKAGQLFKRMQELVDAGRIADGWVQERPGSWRRKSA